MNYYRIVINPNQRHDQQIILNSEQEHYLWRVLRLKKGDRFIALDGKGTSWLVELTETSPEIISILTNNNELPIKVSLLVGLPKGDGFEQIIRSCTELGVSEFRPIITERTLLKPSSNKLNRWRKIAQEAAEQTERDIVPHICEPVDFKTSLSQIDDSQGDRYICVTRQDSDHLIRYLSISKSSEILILTGPEGGLTETEIQNAIAQNFQPVSLGNRILRAITAPIVAVSLVAAVAEADN